MSICDEAVGDCEPDESKDGNHRRYVPFRTCVSRTSSNNGWIIRIAKSLPRSANTAAAMTAFTLLVLVCIAYSCKAGVLDIIWDLDFVCSCQRLCPRTHRHIPLKQHIIYSEQDVFPVLATCDYDVDAC